MADKASTVNFIGIEPEVTNTPKLFTRRVSQTEYVSGGYYETDVNRLLPKDNDALRRKRGGDKIIDEMLCDPEIKKCETVLKVSVLNEGVTFSPAVSKPNALPPLEDGATETPEQKTNRLEYNRQLKRYELAKKYSDFVTHAFENLDTPIRTTLEQMLDAISYGSKVAEQTYREEYNADFGKTLLTLDSIRVKPRSKTKFVVNKFNKVVGFYAPVKVPRKDTDNADGNKIEYQVLPREKFLILTFRGKDGDPRGTSMLECVYGAWWLKQQMWPEYLRWLVCSALPVLVGYTSPNSDRNNVLRDTSGNIVKDEAGNPVYESNVTGLLQALIAVRNNSAIALPDGAKVESINSAVSGDPFKGVHDVLNEEIEMGLLLQTLATSDSRHNTRAASQIHVSILDVLVFFIKGLVVDMITNDVLKPLMKLNFENFDMSLLPVVSMGDSERRDWATDLIALATGWKAGFFTDSQRAGLYKIVGAPEPDIESDRRLAQQQQKDAMELKQTTTTTATKTSPTKSTDSTKAMEDSAMSEKMRNLKLLVKDFEDMHGEL